MRLFFRELPILFCWLMLLLLFSCGENEYTQQNEMTFKIDPNLLGEKFCCQELGFCFSPPRDCLPLPEVTVNQIKDSLKTSYPSVEFLTIEPIKFFFNQQTAFTCLISALPELAVADSNFAKYQQALTQQFPAEQVKQAKFFYNGFDIYQTLIMTDSFIQFKLLIPQSAQLSFQIDYYVPRQFYIENIEAIESSIGSIKKSKK